MTQPPLATVNPAGTSIVLVHLARLWDFLSLLPATHFAVSYHYPTNQAQVSFPGLNRPTAQQLLDAILQQHTHPPASDHSPHPQGLTP